MKLFCIIRTCCTAGRRRQQGTGVFQQGLIGHTNANYSESQDSNRYSEVNSVNKHFVYRTF